MTDLTTWSLADLLSMRSFARMIHRYDDAARYTAELRRRGFTA